MILSWDEFSGDVTLKITVVIRGICVVCGNTLHNDGTLKCRLDGTFLPPTLIILHSLQTNLKHLLHAARLPLNLSVK